MALSAIPVVAGSLRLVDVLGGPTVLPANPRLDTFLTALVVHVASAAVFALVGSFQFPARVRGRHPGWHRSAGRVLVAAGLLVALSGLWMTLFAPGGPGGAVAWAARMTAGTATAVSLLLGLVAIRRRDVPAHRAWMIRAYALAIGAGTQVFTEGIAEGVVGTGDLSKAVGLSSGWLINAAVAEWVIRRRRSGRPAQIRRPGGGAQPGHRSATDSYPAAAGSS